MCSTNRLNHPGRSSLSVVCAVAPTLGTVASTSSAIAIVYMSFFLAPLRLPPEQPADDPPE